MMMKSHHDDDDDDNDDDDGDKDCGWPRSHLTATLIMSHDDDGIQSLPLTH